VTDANGVVANRKDFSAFGEETFTAQRTAGLKYQPDNIRQDYTGHQEDDESGLEFAQARYYNAGHGRFTSVDPLTASATIRNPQTFNRYSYVLNSPYKYTDPLGLLPDSKSVAGKCNFQCRVLNAINNGGKLSEADYALAVFHMQYCSLIPFEASQIIEFAGFERVQRRSGFLRGSFCL
jgi:RHS repeat-associated protein